MDKKTGVSAVALNRKMNFMAKGVYDAMPRVTHRKARGLKSARFLIRCGCREQSFEIYYSNLDDPVLSGLEIAKVNGRIEDWRAILLPLLGFEREGDVWVDKRNR